MPIVPAKVVTIIVGFEAQDIIEEKLKSVGVGGWSFAEIKGRGQRGNRLGGFVEGPNIAVTVITSEAIATDLLNWVTDELNPINPSVAYAVDAITGRRPKPA